MKHPSLVAMSAALLALAGSPAWAASQQIKNHTPKFVANHKDLGKTDTSKPVHLRLWLKLHQPAQLAQAAAAVIDSTSPRYRQYLTNADIDSNYRPTADETGKIQKYLQTNGLRNVKVAASRMYVEADGSIADAQRLFQVEIHNYSLDGQTVAANSKDPSVDSSIVGSVAYVSGLSTHTMKPLIRGQLNLDGGTPAPTPPSTTPFVKGANGTKSQHLTACFRPVETHTFTVTGATPATGTYTGNRYGADITGAAPNLPPCGYGPNEVQKAYGIDKLIKNGLDGRGQTIVIVDAFGSPTAAADLAAFSSAYGLPAPDLTILQPGGVPVTGTWNANQQGWAGETTLDLEYAHTMAPGAKIILVEAMSDQDPDLLSAISYAIENNLGNQISNSWSGNESQMDPAGQALYDVVLQQAVARGVSIHFSSGDDGDLVKSGGYADVGYPVSSPNVTAIGGTSLALNADGSVMFHSGWGNNGVRIADGVATPDVSAAGQNPVLDPPTSLGFIGGAGGGTSRIYPKPSFQKKLTGTGRMVPDISYLADPYTGVELVESGFDANGNPQPGNLQLQTIGGTSLACPMFSGMWAIANQAHGGKSLGQAAPLLYKLPASAIIDVVPVDSKTNVTGSMTDAQGTNPIIALQLGAPQSETPFYSAIYNSPESPYRWDVITFGTDSGLTTAKGWDNVTGLGIPNGENFVNALK